MKTISIIVPVYKVEKYLSKCIDSILNQTFQEFELILVDDGSPDNCGRICDEYASRDSRIRVIHQENKGISAARNAGLDIAKGEYIAFVDSDDWLEIDTYEFLINNIVKSNADIASCGLRNCYENDSSIENYDAGLVKNIVLSKDQCFEMIFSKNDMITVYAWNKLYKAEVFSDLRYPEGKVYEDAFVILDILLRCNSMFITTKKLYNYRRHENSITGRRYCDEKKDRIVSTEKNYNIFKKYYPQYLEYAEANLCKNYYLLLGEMIMASDKVEPEDMKYIIRKLNDNIWFVLSSKEFTLKRKISALALRIHPKFFKLCVRIQGGI